MKIGTLEELAEAERKKCVWKKTMEDNQKGIGTTFAEYEKLTGKAKDCYYCEGQKPDCGQYWSDTDEEKNSESEQKPRLSEGRPWK